MFAQTNNNRSLPVPASKEFDAVPSNAVADGVLSAIIFYKNAGM